MSNKNTKCKNCEEWFHICSACDISDADTKSKAEGYCCVECLANSYIDNGEHLKPETVELLSIELVETKNKNAVLIDTLSSLYSNFRCSDPPCRDIDPPRVIERDFCDFHKLIANTLKKAR